MFFLKRSLCLVAKRSEAGSVAYCYLGEHLAVQGDVRLLETVDECRVVHSVELAGSGDPCDPESSEVSLLKASADVCILTALPNGFLGGFEELALSAPVALSEL